MAVNWRNLKNTVRPCGIILKGLKKRGTLGLEFYCGNGFLLKGQNCKLMKAFSVSVDFLLNCIS